MVRALVYDRNLKQRAGKTLTIVVLHSEKDDGVQCVRAFLAALGETSVAGLPVRLVPVTFRKPQDFDGNLAEAHAAAMYSCADLGDAVTVITTATRKRGVLTFTDSEADVRAGLSIGVVVRDGKKQLVINVAAAKAEGSRLAPELLRLATLVGTS